MFEGRRLRAMRWLAGSACIVLVSLFSFSPSAMANGLYYHEVDGRVVITNVRDVENLKPLPGFESKREIRAKSPLPASRYDRLIGIAARESGVSTDLIKAVAMVESGLDERAKSPKGAIGLMQLMPETARELGVRDRYDPLENLRGGANYLNQLLDHYDGDLSLTLAAYNAGIGAVKRHGGVPAYRETRNYVRRVQALLNDAPMRSPTSVARVTTTRREVKPMRAERLADGTLSWVND